jgi:hypothetical protein
MNKNEYDNFRKLLEQATNEINQRSAAKTNRKGKLLWLRDKFTFFKLAMLFAFGYVSVFQSLIIFLGITPQAIENINGFLLTLGFSYQFPVALSSFVAIGIICSLVIFGVIAVLVFGLLKREQEIGISQSPGFYLIVKENERIIELLEKNLEQGKV